MLTIDDLLSPGELQLLLASARVPPSALDRAQDLQRRVSGAMVSALALTAGLIYLWDTALLIAT